MATLVLSTVGATLGGSFGPVGSIIGRTVGALAGSAIDSALFSSDEVRHVEGPRLKDVDGLTSTEGAPIPRVYGRARIGGQLVWATRFEEVVETSAERDTASGGKGLAPPPDETTVTTAYSYYANLAVGLCEGPIAFVRRVWADGRPLDLNAIVTRLHTGGEDQPPDPLIVAKEGAANAPAYRGLAYMVFERLPLAEFGNRVPQFSFEVIRPVDGLAGMVRAVCLIPGSTEFGYDTVPVWRDLGLGESQPENRHQLERATDLSASLDALLAICPNLRRVSLVASWFGDDLRAGHCTIRPRVDRAEKETYGGTWSAGGLTRGEALPVSQSGGGPAYGGSPSDASVVRLIQALKARELEVVLYPFVMMDVPAGNALPNPYTNAPGQPPYPWRGRITCHPAPGRPGTPDGTGAAAIQVAALFGAAAPGEFAMQNGTVAHTGADGWSFRRHILHYAHLAAWAGGVHGFVIGSELVGLTRVRSASGVYPAAGHLQALAADVRTVLGPGTAITYAADWTEYGAHVLGGGAELRFPLDPLWAHPAIDAVGIDYYPPIADWRDGPAHFDLAEARSGWDVDYLRRRLGAGEAFDWFYASDADRAAQVRTPITDGAYDKPWVYRAKDLVSWWSNPHVERVGGVETAATAWVPSAKPIWITEAGVPAVDKGANSPNLFPDPKSAENGRPHFSSGARDDLLQARALEAILSRFDPALPGFAPANNPVSPVYDGRMVPPEGVSLWAWDARPFPAFPDFDLVWADGANWQTGHWLNGRIEGASLDRLVAAILRDFGIEAPTEDALDGFLDGYALDRPMSARAALQPLARLFGVDATASGGRLLWRGRGGRAVAALGEDDLVADPKGPSLRLSRASETELPAQVELGFTDGEGEYRRATVASRKLSGASRREAGADFAVVTRRAEMQRLADAWLQDLWAGRETAELELTPRAVAFEPGDLVALPTPAGPRLHRITRLLDGPTRKVTARAVEPAVFATPASLAPRPVRPPPPVPGRPTAIVLDLPVAPGEPTALQYLAVAAEPWPGAVAVWRAADETEGFALHRIVRAPALVGTTLTALDPGPLWRWDRGAALDVRMSGDGLVSVADGAALAGRNAFALRGPDRRWEIFAAARAELIGPRTFRLSRFLRGLAGSEAEAARTVPPGATLVRLDDTVVPLARGLSDLGRPWSYRLAPRGRDHADPSAIAFSATAGPDALRPFAPVRVAARREAGGVRVTWIRRTRLDGDGWEPAETPLGEEREAYAVDILSGGSVLRSLGATGPETLYPAADELADWGAPQAALTIRVAQLSAAVGRGFATEVTLAVA